MINSKSEIGTSAAIIQDQEKFNNKNVVKVITKSKLEKKIVFLRL